MASKLSKKAKRLFKQSKKAFFVGLFAAGLGITVNGFAELLPKFGGVYAIVAGIGIMILATYVGLNE